MGKEMKPTDVFMQFAALEVTWPANTVVLTEGSLKTGLSIRGGLMWLIHMIELDTLPPCVAGDRIELGLSVRDALVAIPSLGDPGCIAALRVYHQMTTSGKAVSHSPRVARFLPPVPLAAPNLSLYVKTTNHEALLAGSKVYARVGYTTTPLDAKSYAEIAETWAYV